MAFWNKNRPALADRPEAWGEGAGDADPRLDLDAFGQAEDGVERAPQVRSGTGPDSNKKASTGLIDRVFGRTKAAKAAKESSTAAPLSDASASRTPIATPQHLALLASDSGQRVLAMGLRWRAMVVAVKDADGHAIKEARRAKASHYVSAPLLLGVGRIPQDVDAQIFSAAMIAAQNAPHAIFAMRLPDGRVWIAQITGGRPSGSEDICDDAFAATQKVAQARQASDELQVWSNIDEIPSRHPYSWDDLMLLPPPAAAQVKKVPRQQLFGQIPAVVRYSAALVVLALGAEQGWNWYQAEGRAQARASMLAEQEQKLQERAQAWQGQLRTELSARATDLRVDSLRQSIDRLPVIWQGWKLQSARCTAAPLTAQQVSGQAKEWTCTAAYQAPDAKDSKQSFAPNKVLSTPAGFEAEYLPPRAANLKWRVSTPGQPVQIARLGSVQSHLVETASLLQANMADLTASEIRFVPIKLVPPQATKGTGGASGADPASQVAPKELAVPLQSALTVKGPLALLDALVPRINADWSAMVLTPSAGVETALSLDIEWTGALYAKP
jgi:hypothetical protein